ncbi:MAG: 3-dehydroquinate synthase [Syntrophaceae bacterium]|nr:3-dehydroquinate synthase [Syntrophaceae bacterium]
MNRIRVHLEHKTSNSYDVHIGRDILDRMGLILAKNAGVKRYVIVTDATVDALHGERVADVLQRLGLKVERLLIPPGEVSKDIRTVLETAERLTALGADRSSALIALGGGVVGDLTGFLASIYMRGIPCVQVPTTLMAQVDSSIGGKTGVDTAAGKNLLGTFYQPLGVFIDTAFLDTLTERGYRDGMAEIVKYGAIEQPELLDRVAEGLGKAENRDPALLEEVIAASCRIKKSIVEIDEKEKGLRRILNFGHTVGHAVEAASDYALSHGESVSIGMAAGAVLSERLGYLPAEDRQRLVAVLEGVGLPTAIPGGISREKILSHLKADKKKTGTVIHFVLLKKLGIPFLNGGVPEKTVAETVEALTV